jgi:two-component system, NarL family, nitrate/nitrite response regulator NarL
MGNQNVSSHRPFQSSCSADASICWSKKMKILVVDDHELILESFTQTLIRTDRSFKITTASTVDGGMKLLEKETYGFVFSDLRFGDDNKPNFDLISACVDKKIRCAVITAHCDAHAVAEAARRGANAYFLKTMPLMPLGALITLVIEHGITYAPLISGEDSNPGLMLMSLTPARRKVLELMCLDKSNKEIAKVIGLSENTIKGYIQRFYEATGVDNRMAAARVFTKMIENESRP